MRGQHREALASHESSRATFARAGEELEAAITETAALQPLSYLGCYRRAFRWAAHARRVFERRRNRVRLAMLDINTANILVRQDRFREALVLYQRACFACRRLKRPGHLALALANIAVCQSCLHAFDDAVRTYRRARASCLRHGLPLVVPVLDYNIANLHCGRGEYARALDLYRATRTHSNQVGDAYHAAMCDLDQAELSLELNLVAEATDLAGSARRKLDDLGMAYEAAKALNVLAIAASRTGDHRRALSLFTDARRRFRRERNPIWPAQIDLCRATVLLEARRIDMARR
ncbi:MAG: tetratricopeptide repeat protein, partial [Chloroflexi bacterium]